MSRREIRTSRSTARRNLMRVKRVPDRGPQNRVMSSSGIVMMIRTCCAVALLAVVACANAATGAGNPAGPDAAAVRKLLTEHKCYICHSDYEAKAGPAYVDVAAQFRGRREAEEVIAAEIRNGIRGGGPWHMPPHPEVSANEARAIARYIMSIDARARPAQ